MYLLETSKQTRVQTEGKTVFIEGVFAVSGTPTENQRLYSVKIHTKAFNALNESIRAGQCTGELSHGLTPQKNPHNISHIVESLERKGNQWWGRARLLETPAGFTARNLLENGIHLGVSTKGSGTTRESNGIHYVTEDFVCHGFDLVCDPASRHYIKALEEQAMNKNLSLAENHAAQVLLNEANQNALQYRPDTPSSSEFPSDGAGRSPGVPWNDEGPGNYGRFLYSGHDGYPSLKGNEYADQSHFERHNEAFLELVERLYDLESEFNYTIQNPHIDSRNSKDSYIRAARDPFINAYQRIASKEDLAASRIRTNYDNAPKARMAREEKYSKNVRTMTENLLSHIGKHNKS